MDIGTNEKGGPEKERLKVKIHKIWKRNHEEKQTANESMMLFSLCVTTKEHDPGVRTGFV